MKRRSDWTLLLVVFFFSKWFELHLLLSPPAQRPASIKETERETDELRSHDVFLQEISVIFLNIFDTVGLQF